MSALALAGVRKAYGARTALAGIDLEVAAGEVVVLLGPSGCGKTTLLSILGGFVSPDAGHVEIGGRDVTTTPAARRPTATVFQDYALFPHMDLADNVAFGLRMRGAGRRARRARAGEMLALVGLDGAARLRPQALSGGQRQRVALARALAVEPEVLLLDEPLGALDLHLRRAMQDELKTLQRRLGTTFVHVTHDQEEAMALADRLVVMNAGRIEDAGPPAEVYRRPNTLFAAGFLGEMTPLFGRVAGPDRVSTALGTLTLPAAAFRHGPPREGDQVTLCLRPEQVGLDGDVDLGPARTADAAFCGTHWRCRMRTERGGLDLIAHLPPGHDPGATVDLRLDTGSVVALGGET